MFRALWVTNRGGETKETQGKRHCGGHACRHAVGRSCSMPEEGCLRTSGPWATHTGAETSPQGLLPTGSPCQSRWKCLRSKEQHKEVIIHWLQPPALPITSPNSLGHTECYVLQKQGELWDYEGEGEVFDWSWVWERKRKGDSLSVHSIVYIYFFLFNTQLSN